MSAKPKSYKLTTIRDIFDKVPAARIEDCCRELGILMATTKAFLEGSIEHAKSKGKLPASASLKKLHSGFTFPLMWVDDGKGDIQSILASDKTGEPLVSLEIKPEKKGGAS